MKIYDTAIVGGGIAGYTAALTSKTLLLDYIWFAEEGFGKLRYAERLTNFPANYSSGAEMAAALEAQLVREGLSRTPIRIDGIYKTGEGFLLTAGEQTSSARTVILATGVERKGLLRGEAEFLGRGVSYCAVCDGALYRGKRIAALLSEPRFEAEAEYLARFAAKVYCFCSYPSPRLSGKNIEVRAETPVGIQGGARVEKLLLKEGELEVDGVFLLKSSAPPAALAGGLRTDGVHVTVARDLSTNLKGLFCAGDITGRPYQYAKAAGEGCVAAHAVRDFLRNF